MDMTVEVAETQIKMFHHLERPSHCTQMNNVAVEMEQKKWAPDGSLPAGVHFYRDVSGLALWAFVC